MGVRDVAEAVGKGLFAAAKVLGVRPIDEQSEARFANIVHWGYGTGWGVARGLLRALGLPPRAATIVHLALVYGGEQIMLPGLGVAPPATEWGGEEVAIDAWHHVVYVAATAAAFEWLRRGSGRRDG